MEEKRWNQEFTDRMMGRYAELKGLYQILYPGQTAFLEDLCDKMYEWYEARSEALKQLDRKRAADTSWYKKNDLIGMMMYTDCFAGDLQGVKKNLDYLQECHVNYLHLMPLLASPPDRSDGGYAVADFRSIQPALGNMTDLEDLAAECHKRGLSICLDFVMNHTSEDHEWAVRAKNGEKEYRDRYFFFDNHDIPSWYEQTVPQVFPTTAPGNFTWLPEEHQYVMTTFYPYQWDLNYKNPIVLNEMVYNMLNLANKGIDIMRIDAVPYIWKELGTTCRNLPQVHFIVRIMRMITEIVCPGVILLGEVVMEPEKVVPYFGTVDRPECHLLYNVTTMATTWHTVATRDVSLLRHQMDIVNNLPKEYVFLNYLRCHDDIGWGLDYNYLAQFGIEQRAHKEFLNNYLTGHVPDAVGRGELYNSDPQSGDARLCGTTASLCGLEKAVYEWDRQAEDRAVRYDQMLHAYMLVQSGIPVVYSGDEIGQFNDYSYKANPHKITDSRYLHRGNFRWDLARKRYEEGSYQERLFYTIGKLELIRGKEPVFCTDAQVQTIDTWDSRILGLSRTYGEDKLIALFNFGESDETAWINECDGMYEDLFTGKRMEAKAVLVPAGGFFWLKRVAQ